VGYGRLVPAQPIHGDQRSERAISGNIGSDWGSRSIARPYRASARNSTYVLLHSPAVCGTGAGAGFAPPFLTVAFFPGACLGARCLGLCFAAAAALALAARTAAQRFLVAATMAARPAAESRRLGFTGWDGPTCRRDSAHRFRWAAAIRARPSALILRVGLAAAMAFAGAFRPRALRISAMRAWMPSS